MFKFNLPKKEKIISKTKECAGVVLKTVRRFMSAVAQKTASAIEFATPHLEAFAQLLVGLCAKLRGLRVKTVAATLVFAICLSVPMVAYAAEYTSAVEVRYGDRSFGFVVDTDEAEQVKETVRTSIYGNFDIEQFSFDKTTANKENIAAAEEVAVSVIEEADGIKPACGLYVDGVLKAISDGFASMNSALKVGITHYTADGSTFTGFSNSVMLRDIHATDAYYDKLAVSVEDLLDGDYGLQFKTTNVERFEQEIEFEKVIEYNKNQKTSYEKVKQKGKNGLKSVTANVSYINGVKVDVEEIDSVVVKEPQQQITVKGTKKAPVYHSGYVLATKIMTDTAEMVFPVDCNGSTYISSFWGDGRGHKGLDIAAPKNTNVYAAADGVVTYAGRRSDYGYMIVIDHNDGKTQTVYSHNSKNLVSKGDTVKAGQHIAEVGATGNATGNHLHFEVRINGTAVDAAPYVGLK